jgi:hypothetical protein
VLDDCVRALARDAGHILWTARPDGTAKSLTTWQLYCGEEHGATRLVRKLFLAIKHRIEKSPGHESLIAAGIALSPRRGTDAETLLRHAQSAAATSEQTSGGYAVYGSIQQQQK